MPVSDPHADCLRCLGETHLSDRCKICKLFKPRTKRERDLRFWAILMEAALTPTPARHSESAPGTAALVHGDPTAPSTDRHRSLSAGHAKKRPSLLRHWSKTRREARPMLGSPYSPSAFRPPTQVEQSSPAHSEQASPYVRMPSTPEALQAAWDVMSMPVPGALPTLAPQSRGKPPLGSPQLPLARYRTQSRECSRRCSPLSDHPLLGDYDKVKAVSEGSNCQCKCLVRPLGRGACQRINEGTSKAEDFYTVETISSGPDCKCACVAPPSALNPCEGDFRLKKLREAESSDLKLSSIIEMLESAFYGLDLLKLHSVTTKLVGRVEKLEEEVSRNLTRENKPFTGNMDAIWSEPNTRDKENCSSSISNSLPDIQSSLQRDAAAAYTHTEEKYEERFLQDEMVSQQINSVESLQQLLPAPEAMKPKQPLQRKMHVRSRLPSKPTIIRGITYYKAKFTESENDLEEQDESFSGDHTVDLLIEDQLLRHTSHERSSTTRTPAPAEGPLTLRNIAPTMEYISQAALAIAGSPVAETATRSPPLSSAAPSLSNELTSALTPTAPTTIVDQLPATLETTTAPGAITTGASVDEPATWTPATVTQTGTQAPTTASILPTANLHKATIAMAATTVHISTTTGTTPMPASPTLPATPRQNLDEEDLRSIIVPEPSPLPPDPTPVSRPPDDAVERWVLVQGKRKARAPLLSANVEAPRKTRKGGTDTEPSALPLGLPNSKDGILFPKRLNASLSRTHFSCWIQRRCKDTLSTISGPTTQNTYGRNEGAWMKDPLAKDERIYVTNYYYGNTLVEFRNLENFKQGRWSNSYKLPYSWIGTGHAVYNGSLYYNRAFTRNIIKYDLKQRYVAAWAMLHDVAYEEVTPWQWQGHSDVDFAVDENGLWVIYPAINYEGFSQEVIVLSKLNAADLSTQKETTWRTGLRRNFYGNCFVICGVLYAVDSYNHKNANISYAFDTHTNTQIIPRLLFENEYSYITQIDYNPKDRLLYAWDNGHQVTYHVIFAY
ncbi:Olfactomedin-like protein 2B [Chelonia mydas]|uniref:Olfactomedin-like protein 2B n=1 Tax=Chelonia mydas TaxID=8469 RepID=M7CE25_CHEMY|nr:Olfactomedin-like protein 2B [Chelonia mydas]